MLGDEVKDVGLKFMGLGFASSFGFTGCIDCSHS